jgi:hypothetical protein
MIPLILVVRNEKVQTAPLVRNKRQHMRNIITGPESQQTVLWMRNKKPRLATHSNTTYVAENARKKLLYTIIIRM